MNAGCWASQGYTAEGCVILEQQLRQCMDAPVRIPFLYPSWIYNTQSPITQPIYFKHTTYLTTTPHIQKPKSEKRNAINYHLMRMYPKVVGPKKKDGVLG